MKAVLDSFSDKVVPEQRAEGSEGVSHVFIWKGAFPREGAGSAKALRCGSCLVCWENGKGVGVQGGVS